MENEETNEENTEEVEQETSNGQLQAEETQEESNLEVKEEPKKKTDNRYSRRVEELNTKFRTEQREKELLQEENRKLKEAQTIKDEPDADDYVDNDKFSQDKAQWNTQEQEKYRAEGRREAHQEAVQKKQQEKQNEVITHYGEQRVAGAETYKDFYSSEKKVGDILTTHGEYATEVRDSILEAKNSAALINHFGKHPDKLQDIAYLSPRDQAKAVWALDKELGAKPVKKQSSAPDPIRSEKGSATRTASSNEGGSKHIHKKGETFRERAIRLNKR